MKITKIINIMIMIMKQIIIMIMIMVIIIMIMINMIIDDTWEGETPYKKSEHHYVGEDCSEIGNLVMMIMVIIVMMIMMIMMILVTKWRT